MGTNIKIRGIYATALTKLFGDAGYGLADPSSTIRKLFGFEELELQPDITLKDRDGHQGVEIQGESELVYGAVSFLQNQLLDATLLKIIPADEPEGWVTAVIEFPGASKAALDEIRHQVKPTLVRHHRLRIVAGRILEHAEASLEREPEEKSTISAQLFTERILEPLKKAGLAKLEHVRPSGQCMRPREGIITEINSHRLVFKRIFRRGRYDGLNLPITDGDYGLTEVEEGAWSIKHTYFRCDGTLIGEYYNINTPVELYPYGARYLDLEVDIVRRAGQTPVIIDTEKLSLLAQNGQISTALHSKVRDVVEEIMRKFGT